MHSRRRLAREAAQTTRRLEKLHKERDFYILVSWKIGGDLLVLLYICNLGFPPTNRTMITPVTSSRKAKIVSRPSVEALRLVTFGLFQHFETTPFVTCMFSPIMTTTRRLEKLQKQPDVYIRVSWKIGGDLLVLLYICNLPTNKQNNDHAR